MTTDTQPTGPRGRERVQSGHKVLLFFGSRGSGSFPAGGNVQIVSGSTCCVVCVLCKDHHKAAIRVLRWFLPHREVTNIHEKVP